MPRRPAAITQADVARAIRAAKQTGAVEVEVQPEGKILIRLRDPEAKTSTDALPNDGEIVL
jgi:hypothetical protein